MQVLNSRAGIGNYTSYDATKGGDNGDNYSVTYEVKDEHTVVITSDGFLGSSVYLFIFYEDEKGKHLQRTDNGWIYNKLEAEDS